MDNDKKNTDITAKLLAKYNVILVGGDDSSSNENIVDNETEIINTDPLTSPKENINTGVIYCITNKINNKKYVGQTASYITDHGKIKKHGLKGRFKDHCANALNESRHFKNKKLYPEMKQYGIDNFEPEILAVCDSETLNIMENFYIMKFKCIQNGYNTTLNGYGKMLPEDNLMRIKNISNTMIKRWQDPEYIKKTLPASVQAILKRADEGVLRKKNIELKLPANIYKTDTGYDIRIMRDGKCKITSVEGKDLSDEQKLQQAIKRKEEILFNMNNNIDDSLHKKTDHNDETLPAGIVKFKARGNEGYKVIVRHLGKRKEKNFTDGKLTMPQKLELAKKAQIEMLANKVELINKPIADRLDHNGVALPTNIIMVNKNDKQIGYAVCINNTKKGFCVGSKTMDEKLQMSINHLNTLKK